MKQLSFSLLTGALLALGAAGSPLFAQDVYNKGAVITLSGGASMYIPGNLTNTAGGNISSSGSAVRVDGNVDNNSSSTLDLGAAGTLEVRGNLTNAATLTPGTGSVSLTGTAAAQTLDLNGAQLYDLTVNNTSAAKLVNVPSSVSVSHNLTLTTGMVKTAASPAVAVILPDGATLTGEGVGRYVAGNLRGVLLGYTRAYDGYVEHGDRAGTGRLQPQSLCEAVWMLRAERVCGALLAIDALSPAELTEVRSNLFAPAIALLRRQTSDVHNIHVWTAAAVWALAWRCEQPADVAFAERILALNLERGVLAHGSWYELSPLYHYYTCEALLTYARAAHAAGRPSLVDAALPAMLRAPLALALNHGQIVLVNDGWQTNALADKAWFYELAEGLWGGFSDVLGHLYTHVGAERDGIIALLYGPDTVAPAHLVHPLLTVVDGLAVVRRRGLTAWIKATAHAGGHDHPDKPALNLQLDGCDLRAGDIGNPGYGSPYHGDWFKRTWSHNALLVDGSDASCGPARIDRTVHTPWVSVVTAGSDEAYPGVRIRRVVLVGDGWVVDWIRAESSQTHR